MATASELVQPIGKLFLWLQFRAFYYETGQNGESRLIGFSLCFDAAFDGLKLQAIFPA